MGSWARSSFRRAVSQGPSTWDWTVPLLNPPKCTQETPPIFAGLEKQAGFLFDKEDMNRIRAKNSPRREGPVHPGGFVRNLHGGKDKDDSIVAFCMPGPQIKDGEALNEFGLFLVWGGEILEIPILTKPVGLVFRRFLVWPVRTASSLQRPSLSTSRRRRSCARTSTPT